MGGRHSRRYERLLLSPELALSSTTWRPAQAAGSLDASAPILTAKESVSAHLVTDTLLTGTAGPGGC